MKTVLVCFIQISIICLCTCIMGDRQPPPNHVSLMKQWSYGENVLKKCKDVNGDITTRNFLDEDTLLCFGLNVLSQRFPGKVESSAVLDGVEKKPDADICKNFQDMRLNSTLEKSNHSIAVYNRQFQDMKSCEQACLDVIGNVNPLCSIILLLSRHSKGNPIGSDTKDSFTTLPGDKAQNGDNEVSNVNVASTQSRNFVGEVSNKIPDKQKSKPIDAGGVVAVQNTEISTQEQAPVEQKLSKNGVDKSHIQRIPEQTSRGIISSSTDNVNKLHEQKQQTVETETGSDKEKPKVSGEGEGLTLERPKVEPATNGIQDEKGHNTPNIGTPSDTSKNTANSKKEPKDATLEDTNLVSKNENQVKPDHLPEKNIPKHSSVVPGSSDGDEKEEVGVTKPKLEEKFSAAEDKLTSDKVVGDTGPQKEESISHVPNVAEGKDIDDDQKTQANHKEKENPPPKDVELQISSKTKTEAVPKSNIDEQKTNQNNKKAYGNENAETAPPSGVDNTQKTVSEEMQFTDNAGDGVAELDTHFSVEAGELNDNTEFTSGGGTGVDYARPDSDVLETDKNDMDAGTVVIHEKYEDDDSHFFAYFMTTMVFCIVGYLLFHNKQKILALALEGRARRGRRRPNTSGYRKLDSNLEEAISSSKSASVTQVIY